ncbi:MAG: hypothetical protein WA803_13030 [Steroidobacteraceae bacterium]
MPPGNGRRKESFGAPADAAPLRAAAQSRKLPRRMSAQTGAKYVDT